MPKCFIVPKKRDRERDRERDGERDGERDRECDFLPPSIFLIFKYNNKHNFLIQKTCLKVASAYLIRSYEYFEFQNLEI